MPSGKMMRTPTHERPTAETYETADPGTTIQTERTEMIKGIGLLRRCITVGCNNLGDVINRRGLRTWVKERLAKIESPRLLQLTVIRRRISPLTTTPLISIISINFQYLRESSDSSPLCTTSFCIQSHECIPSNMVS